MLYIFYGPMVDPSVIASSTAASDTAAAATSVCVKKKKMLIRKELVRKKCHHAIVKPKQNKKINDTMPFIVPQLNY